MVTSHAVYQGLRDRVGYYPSSDLTDCNTVSDGFFCSNNVSNAPNGHTGYVYVLTLSYNRDNNYRIQFATLINNQDIYLRCKVAGTWQTTWRKIQLY